MIPKLLLPCVLDTMIIPALCIRYYDYVVLFLISLLLS